MLPRSPAYTLFPYTTLFRSWQQFGYRDKVHIRRVHYQIVSQRTPVLMPNSKPYENTSECWDMLNMASKAARYLQLLRSEEHTSELQSRQYLVCRLLLEKKNL